LTKRLLNQKSELLYVGINNPVELRRDVLMSSKDTLNLMRKIEILQALRRQKEEVRNILHHIFEELIVLNKKLRTAMPKTSIPEAPVILPEPVAEMHEEPSAPRTKLQILEDELAAIENKLAALE